MHELRKGLYGCQATLAAVETGLLDLTGKALGVSMCELLGGRFRDAVEVHGSVGWEESPGAMAESARRQAGQYRVLKLYAGRGQLHGDLERIEAARDAVGAGHPFIVDVNGLWRQREVLEVCGALAHAQVEVLEQPVSPTDVAGMAAVTRVLGEAHGIDVAADESVTQASDVLVAATHRTASLINVGFMKLGGPAAAHGIATLAGAANLGVMVGSVVELGIASAAGLHLAASLPELGAPSYLVGSGKYVRQITSPIPVDHDGFMCVPTGPGLGIEVDEEAITALDLRKAR
jgi:muconate cycloisomerase